MFLDSLPTALQIVVLCCAGAAAGALINLAIYQLGYFRRRAISPWTPPATGVARRMWKDRLPVLGWLWLRREEHAHGRRFWVRPLVIELTSAVGFTGLYYWIGSGALIGVAPTAVTQPTLAVVETWMSQWFFLCATLFALLTVATFIDFDERTIPDWITTPGTLFALAVLAMAPTVRLPNTTIEQALVAGRQTAQVEPLTIATPHPLGNWHRTAGGMLAAGLILLIWTFALIPKWFTLRWGIVRGVKYFWASIRRPPRRTEPKIQIRPRRMHAETIFHLAFFPIGLAALFALWRLGGTNWDALYGGVMGLAFGGGLVWAVRIIAGAALGEEAMGFGDVTLMAMIGAFLGWQATLLVFVFAPFCAVLIAITQFLLKGDRRLAFGPYLCLSCLILVIFWSRLWNHWARDQIFILGPMLLVIIGVSLVMMAFMLAGMRLLRR